MFSRKDGTPSVIVPTADQDRPSWVKIGVIAAVGFAVGILWPRLAGLRLAPSAPETGGGSNEGAGVVTGASASAATLVASAAPSGSAPMASSAAASPPAPPQKPVVTVGHGFAYACKTSDGESLRGSGCGALPGLERVVRPRLEKLSECSGAAASVGKLQVMVHADFVRETLTVNSGKGTTIAAPEAALACARKELEGIELAGIAHTHKRYSVAYTVTFASPSAATAPRPETAQASDASTGVSTESGAEVVWEVGIVRDAPKTGHIIARLPRGTKIRVGPPKDGWYPIKYGAEFANEGFLYRGAIGR